MSKLKNPPPSSAAELPENVLFVMSMTPALKIPPALTVFGFWFKGRQDHEVRDLEGR